MYPRYAAVSLLLLAAADAWKLDCVCRHIDSAANHSGQFDLSGLTYGEQEIWRSYCEYDRDYVLPERCENLWPPSIAERAVEQLVPRRRYDDEEDEEGEEECGAALAEVRGLTEGGLHSSWNLTHLIAADCIDSFPAPRSNDTEWNATVLAADDLREPALSQLVRAVRRITKVIATRDTVVDNHFRRYENGTEFQDEMPVLLEHLSRYWRDSAQLLSLGVEHVSRLFVPLAFHHVGNHSTDQQLHGWIKDLERVRDMLHTKLRGWVRDVQFVSEQIRNYKVEEDKKTPGKYILRRPLLGEGLLKYSKQLAPFRDNFDALCKERRPEASQVLGLADALYSFYRTNWLEILPLFNHYTPPYISITDEEWQQEDRSATALSVHTDCLQLLADALDHPTCPLEDLPPETIRQREQCRQQLWGEMVLRSHHVPVTSYLAYTQRADVSLCLLASMAANPFGVCEDVPFSVIQSVHDANCFLGSPDDHSCLQSNSTDAICYVSRAVLFLKCHDFIYSRSPSICVTYFPGNRNLSGLNTSHIQVNSPTKKLLSYRYSLNTDVLKYTNFKIDSLKSLEISFIAINIIFRFLTVGVYMYFPQLRTLPGKILLCFQMMGIIQISCSEIVYRMAGVPSLSAMVQIDSCLTLLSCMLLNVFWYQTCSCVRNLKLPNDLPPAEANKILRRQVLYALIPWSIVCTVNICLENTEPYYVFESRLIFVIEVSISVSLNLIFLGLWGFMHVRLKNSMRSLGIPDETRSLSKEELFFMSVKTVFLSGIGTIIRVGLHQTQGLASAVYGVHFATMLQGPLLFVLFVCNPWTRHLLWHRLLLWWDPSAISQQQELCSSARRNVARRTNVQPLTAESSL